MVFKRVETVYYGCLQALRGIALVVAATLVAELGDITRFSNPRQLMAFIGLVPSEHTSGRSRRQGGITKAGNTVARRMLVDAACSYRFPARISRQQLLQQNHLAKPINQSGKAQERLCRRHRKLIRAQNASTKAKRQNDALPLVGPAASSRNRTRENKNADSVQQQEGIEDAS